jgi:hypothetical protein
LKRRQQGGQIAGKRLGHFFIRVIDGILFSFLEEIVEFENEKPN